MKSKFPTPEALIGGIQQAERDLDKAREAMVQRGWVNDWQMVTSDFVLSFENLLLSVRDAVRTAEESGNGAFMNQLNPVLCGATRLIQARRAIDGDRVNNPAAKFNRFIQTLDQLIPTIRRLDAPPRPPQIQSVREMAKDGVAIPGIMNVWRHLGVITVENIARNEADDVPGEQHPEYIAWRESQQRMPAFDDSTLAGEGKSIERSRERGAAPAIV